MCILNCKLLKTFSVHSDLSCWYSFSFSFLMHYYRSVKLKTSSIGSLSRIALIISNYHCGHLHTLVIVHNCHKEDSTSMQSSLHITVTNSFCLTQVLCHKIRYSNWQPLNLALESFSKMLKLPKILSFILVVLILALVCEIIKVWEQKCFYQKIL